MRVVPIIIGSILLARGLSAQDIQQGKSRNEHQGFSDTLEDVEQAAMGSAMVVDPVSSQTLTHQERASVTNILFNRQTGQIEIFHRFILDEAEYAISEVTGARIDLLGNPKSQIDFASYVMQAFSLQAGRDSLPLSFVSAEADSDYIWIHQETAIPVDTRFFTLSHGALHDIWPNQINTVNIQRDNMQQTLVFTGNEGAMTISFD